MPIDWLMSSRWSIRYYLLQQWKVAIFKQSNGAFNSMPESVREISKLHVRIWVLGFDHKNVPTVLQRGKSISYPLISSPFPHLPSPHISSPPSPNPHPFLTPLPYSPLPSPYPLIWRTLPYPAISPPQLLPFLPSPRLPYAILPPLPYPTILSPFLTYTILPAPNAFLPSTPLHYLTLPSPHLPSPTPLHYPPPLLSLPLLISSTFTPSHPLLLSLS